MAVYIFTSGCEAKHLSSRDVPSATLPSELPFPRQGQRCCWRWVNATACPATAVCLSLEGEVLHRNLELELQWKSTDACLQSQLLALHLGQHNPPSLFPDHYLEGFSILWHSLQDFNSICVHKGFSRVYLLSQFPKKILLVYSALFKSPSSHLQHNFTVSSG